MFLYHVPEVQVCLFINCGYVSRCYLTALSTPRMIYAYSICCPQSFLRPLKAHYVRETELHYCADSKRSRRPHRVLLMSNRAILSDLTCLQEEMSSSYTSAAGSGFPAVQLEGKSHTSLSHAGGRCHSYKMLGGPQQNLCTSGNLSQQATFQISQLEAICAE